MNNRRLFAATTVMLVMLVMFVVAGAGRAAADPAADRCGGSKTKGAATYAKALFACHAYALRYGEAVDPDCTARAEAKFASVFHRAELVGGGENYGWNQFDGNSCNKPPCPDPPTGFTMPVHDYGHVGGGCAVMGGYAYRGCAMPDLSGTYFFSDLCTTFVHTFEVVGGVATNFSDRTDDAKSTGASFGSVISWGEDARGEIYIIGGNNSIYHIEAQ